MFYNLKLINRVCGAFSIFLIAFTTAIIAPDATPAQARSRTIIVTGKTMPQAFSKAHAQGAKITGCWYQKNKTWRCKAKLTKPVPPPPTQPLQQGSEYITVTGRTMPQAFSKAHAQGAKIIGCSLQKNKTWRCKAKLVNPPSTQPPATTPPTTQPPVTTPPTTQPPTTTPPSTQPPATTPPSTQPPATTPPTTQPPVTTPPPDSEAIPGPVGPTTTNLTPMNGLTITTNGAVIEGVDVTGQITIKANNVTIRNFKANNVYKDPGFSGLLLEDGEIHGKQNSKVNGVVWSHYTARRLNVYGVDDAFKAHGGVLIENCWVHDLAFDYNGGNWSHNDGVQISSGSGLTVRNSRFERIQGTAAIFIKPDQGPISNVTIENNIFGGGAYTLYSQRKNGYPDPTNILIRDNAFLSEHIYGPLYVDNPNTVLIGNKLLNGQPIG